MVEHGGSRQRIKIEPALHTRIKFGKTARIELSEQQGAKLFALRARTSLARLWRDRGERNEAQLLLAPVYASFTEGLKAPDLLEARRLLEELEGSSPPPDLEAPRDVRSESSSMDSLDSR